jgi:hypothetical protein
MRGAMKDWTCCWKSATLAAAVSAVALAACDQNRPMAEPPAATTPPPAATTPGVAASGTSVAAIKEAPEQFYGKTVTVSGELDKLYNERAFELDGTGWAFNDDITVLTKAPVHIVGVPLAAGDEVIVTGTVHSFVAADVERNIGWDIGPDVESKLAKRPVLIADSIRKVAEYGRWSASGAAEPVTMVVTIVTMVDPAAAGRKVELERERVQSVMGKGLWVGPSKMSQVFVLPAGGLKDIQPGDWVRVTGTLQKAPKDAGKTWDFPANTGGIVSEEELFVDAATVTEVPQRPAGAERR